MSILFVINSLAPILSAETNKYEGLSGEKLQLAYQKEINRISIEKSDKTTDSLGSYLQKSLVKDVFPAWYGTSWDYNGYTNKPNEGVIACGYFVSTTLKHIGFNLNRYELAKKYSLSIVKTLGTDIKTFTDTTSLFQYLLKGNNHIYVVGLSNHVGFLVKMDSKVYFIHANYTGPVAVEKEEAEKSEALSYSDIYVVGNLSGNKALLQKWKSGARIEVVD